MQVSDRLRGVGQALINLAPARARGPNRGDDTANSGSHSWPVLVQVTTKSGMTVSNDYSLSLKSEQADNHDGSYNDEMLVQSFHRQRIVHSDNAVYALGDILRSLFFVDTINRSGQPHPAYEGLHADR